MRRSAATLAIALIAAIALGGVFLTRNASVWNAADAPDMTYADLLGTYRKAASDAEEARAECQKETQDWRFKECLERIPEPSLVFAPSVYSAEPSATLVRRANEGDPEAALKYGYHIVGTAVVNGTEPLEAIPYLMTAALAGDIGAHVQLGLIETVSRKDGDLVKAWAHFDSALQAMPPDAPDYRRSKMHMEDIEADLSEAELAMAKALSADFSDTMRTNRNSLK